MATTKATTLAHTLGGISSDISTAEINRLDGLTGDIQTLLNLKAPIASPTFTGTANISSGATFPSNPTVTLGSNTTFPTGIVESETIIKYAFGSNDSYAHASTSITIATRKSSSDTAVESVSVIGGYTYIYEYTGFSQAYSGATIQRTIGISLYDDATNRSQSGTTVSGLLNTIHGGRELNANGSTFATSQIPFVITGASYYSSDDTRYIYLGTSTGNTACTVALHFGTALPVYLKIIKIKGNILTTRT